MCGCREVLPMEDDERNRTAKKIDLASISVNSNIGAVVQGNSELIFLLTREYEVRLLPLHSKILNYGKVMGFR